MSRLNTKDWSEITEKIKDIIEKYQIEVDFFLVAFPPLFEVSLFFDYYTKPKNLLYEWQWDIVWAPYLTIAILELANFENCAEGIPYIYAKYKNNIFMMQTNKIPWGKSEISTEDLSKAVYLITQFKSLTPLGAQKVSYPVKAVWHFRSKKIRIPEGYDRYVIYYNEKLKPVPYEKPILWIPSDEEQAVIIAIKEEECPCLTNRGKPGRGK